MHISPNQRKIQARRQADQADCVRVRGGGRLQGGGVKDETGVLKFQLKCFQGGREIILKRMRKEIRQVVDQGPVMGTWEKKLLGLKQQMKQIKIMKQPYP